MSFVIQCPACPTQLSVGAEMSNQQVRCPNCNTVLQVGELPPPGAAPAPAPQKTAPVAAPKPKPRPAAGATATRTQTKPAPAPKKPAPATARDFNLDEEGQPRPRQGAPPTDRDIALNEEEPRPRPAGSGSRGLLLLIVFLIGLGGGGAAGFFGLRSYFKPKTDASSSGGDTTTTPKTPPPPDDLVYLPNNCQILASVLVPKCLASKPYKRLADAGVGLEESENETLRRLLGAGSDEIERLTLGANVEEGVDWTLVVRSLKPIRLAEVKSGEGTNAPKELSVGEQTVYERAPGDAFFLANERTLILGPRDALERVIQRKGQPAKLAAGLKGVYHPLNDSWGFWGGIDVTALSKLPGLDKVTLNALSEAVEAVVVESPTEADRPLECQIVVKCKDDTAADGLRDQVNTLVKVQARLAGSMGELFDGMQFESKNARVAGKITIPAARLVGPLTEMKWENPEYWVASLTDTDENSKKATARLLADPKKALPLLMRALEKDQKTRTAVLVVLSSMKENGKEAAPAVARLVTHPQADLRLHAVKVLGDFGPAAKREVLAALLQAESDSDDRVRLAARKARDALGPLEAADAEVFARRLADQKLDVRTRAANLTALGPFIAESPDYMQTVLDALKDNAKELRAGAVAALGKVGVKQRDKMFPALAAALKDPEAEVKAAAATALEGFGAPTDKESAVLLEAFKDPGATPPVMVAVAKMLGKAGPAAGKDAFAVILGGLTHEDQTVRAACGAALEALPAPDVSEAPALAQKLSDDKASAETKRFVLKTLAKFGDKLDRAKVPTLGGTLMKLIEGDKDLAEPALQLMASLGPPGPDLVPGLLRLMQSKTAAPATRGFAAGVLAPLGATSPEIATALLSGLTDEDAAVRRLSAEGLGKAGLKTPEAAQALAKGLDDKDAAIRLQVTAALAAMPPEAKTYPHLLRAYEDKDEAVVRKAIEGLARGAKPDAAALAAALKSPSLRTRLSALSDLAELKEAAGKDVLEVLVAAARDDSPTVRLLAVNALAASGADPALLAPSLVGKLKDKEVSVQMAAALALIRLKQEPKEVIPLLLTVASDKTSLGQPRAVEALGKLGDWAKPAMPLLLDGLKKEETRAAAGEALGALGKEAVKDLKDTLEKTRDPSMQIAVLGALGKIGPDARVALLPVNTLTKSVNPEVREAAKKASADIQKPK